MERRMIGIFCVITLLMTTAIFRIYYINESDYLTMAASTQGRYNMEVSSTRGTIYDRNFRPLVNTRHRYLASVVPTPQSATALLEAVEEDAREAVLERLTAATPFVLEVDTNRIYADGIDVFRVPLRYSEEQLAPHIVGYLGDGGVGVAGIERAYNDLLTQRGGSIAVTYSVDAVGRTLEGERTRIKRVNDGGAGGVVLTLDTEIQALAQNALAESWDSGAVVVMEANTGNIVAMASLPAFDQNDIAASLESAGSPFINRAVSGYNIGSVFKMVVSAAALENNISRYYQYDCQGFIDVGGQIFRCNNHAVHGVVDMERALEVSCNTYFINLAQQIGPDYILSLCRAMGLEESVELADGLNTQKGNLPEGWEVATPAGLANFSFGQGSSLASPLQMAQVVATIVNGGTAVVPRLVEGTTEDGETFDTHAPRYVTSQILSSRTAETMQEMLVSVVETGSGKPARPVVGGAGGKTSSAQTGQMTGEGEEEKEIVHAWFAGFYPAENPRYSIVVFCEGGESGEQVAAPIFKKVADGIASLEY